MPPLNPQKLLDVAKGLLTTPKQNEEHFRSSTNRAYYSIFHECSKIAVLKLNATPMKGHGSSFKHHELCDAFNNHKRSLPVTTQRDYDIWQIATLFRQIKDLRVDADYMSNLTYTQANAHDAIQYSDEIMRLLKNI